MTTQYLRKLAKYHKDQIEAALLAGVRPRQAHLVARLNIEAGLQASDG